MKSSWAWMMVLVASGSGLIRAQPQIDVRKLNGKWYPLAKASKSLSRIPFPWYEIQSKDTNSFDVILPILPVTGGCKVKRYTYIAKEGGGFQMKGGRYIIDFKDTDYNNYFIMTRETKYFKALNLYARKKVLTEEMRAKFQSQLAKNGLRQEDVYKRIEILSCQK